MAMEIRASTDAFDFDSDRSDMAAPTFTLDLAPDGCVTVGAFAGEKDLTLSKEDTVELLVQLQVWIERLRLPSR
jgi:hypothetical protein